MSHIRGTLTAFVRSLLPRFLGRSFPLLAALAVLTGGWAQAQTAHLAWAQRPLGPTRTFPTGMAVAGNGNVYVVSNPSNGSYQVDQDTPSSTGFSTTIPITLMDPITAIAADGLGTVYLYDSATSNILVQPNASSGPGIPIGIAGVTGLAADAAGNLFYATSTGVNQDLLDSSGIPFSYQGPASFPGQGSLSGTFKDVAVDAKGNVYFTLKANGSSTYAIYKSALLVSGYDTSPQQIASGMTSPVGLAADAAGNVFYADQSNNNVYKVAVNGTGAYAYAPSPVAWVTGMSALNGIAAAPSGNLYLSYGNLSEITQPLEILAKPDFGTVKVNSTSPAMTLVFSIDATPTTLGSLPATLVQGTPDLDFQRSGGGTLVTNGVPYTYIQGNLATVDVTFTPSRPGLRSGAVVLQDGSGQAIATGYVQGTGTGPQAAFPPAALATLIAPNSNAGLAAVAADGGRTLYYVTQDSNGAHVFKRAPDNSGGFTSSKILTKSSYDIVGLAVDGAGDLYLAEYFSHSLYKETPAASGYTEQLLFNGLANAERVAVDASGNVYATDSGTGGSTGTVWKLAWNGISYDPAAAIGTALDSPKGLAVDAFGDVFFTSNGGNLLWKGTPTASNPTWAKVTLTPALSNPGGLAVDGFGNVYVADAGNQQVVKVAFDSQGNPTRSVVTPNAAPLDAWDDVAVDGAGTLYACASSTDQLAMLDYADAPSMAFPDTPAGSTSTAQTLTVLNNGDQDLVFQTPVSGTNPSVPAGFIYDDASTLPRVTSTSGTFTLNPGASADLAIDFQPAAAGPTGGSLVLTSNHLNAAAPGYFTHTVNLSGTGTVPAVVPVTITLDPASLSCTYTGQPQQAKVLSTSPAGVQVDLTYDGSSIAPTAANTYQVLATVHDTTRFSGSAGGTLTIAKATIIGVGLNGLTVTYDGHPHAVTASTYPAGAHVDFTYDGGATPPTNAGIHPLVGTVNDPNFNSYTFPTTLTILKAAARVTLGGLAQIFTGAPLAATASTVPAGLGVSFTYSQNGSAAVPTAVGSYAVTATVNDTNYQGSASDTLVIDPAPAPAPSPSGTTTTLAVTGGPNVTNTWTLLASVTCSGGVPTGTVEFFDGATLLASAAVTPAGTNGSSLVTATFSTSTLGLGSHSFTARYQGDANSQASGSAAMPIDVKPLVTFASTGQPGGGTPVQTVPPGIPATYGLTIQAQGAPLTTPVVFSALGLPTGATAVFNPPSVIPGLTASTFTLTIQTPKPSQLQLAHGLRLPGTGGGTFMVTGLLVVPLFRRRRRGAQVLAGLALLLVAGILGCYSSSIAKQPSTTDSTVTVAAQVNGQVVGRTNVLLKVQNPAP